MYDSQDEEMEELGGGGAAAAGGAAAPAGGGTDQWVQCDRCRSWRIVPESAWCACDPNLEPDGP